MFEDITDPLLRDAVQAHFRFLRKGSINRVDLRREANPGRTGYGFDQEFEGVFQAEFVQVSRTQMMRDPARLFESMGSPLRYFPKLFMNRGAVFSHPSAEQGVVLNDEQILPQAIV